MSRRQKKYKSAELNTNRQDNILVKTGYSSVINNFKIHTMNTVNKFFGIVGEPVAWLSLLYCLLAFPLGIFYFTFLLTGTLLGISLIIVWVGIPIILLVMGAWWGFAIFERLLANGLLQVRIPPMSYPGKEENLWKRFLNHLKNPITWKSFGFLFLKFPMGIVLFVVSITLLSVTFALIAAPFIYQYHWIGIGNSYVGSLWFSLILALAGILIGFASLYIFRFLGKVSGILANAMLGDPKHEPAGNGMKR
ncbi:MAG: sensor domain-containing protein [Bacteroidales bacterium]|nr:MAG: sensor domain-containing protein [Bacteroidales bacterium]